VFRLQAYRRDGFVRFAGITARGLVVEFGLQPSCSCGSRVLAVVSQAYRRDGFVRFAGITARGLSSSLACSRRIESNSSLSSSSPSFECQVRVRVISMVMRSERNVRG
jgi:hypothetical protein